MHTTHTQHSSRSSVRAGGGVTLSTAVAEPDTYLIGDSVEDRLNLLEMLVHCSDLSGQVMTTHLALEWGRRILQEFRNQVSVLPPTTAVAQLCSRCLVIASTSASSSTSESFSGGRSTF
jgi:3'5'-cyclic nucleotide phosphodiesterase